MIKGDLFASGNPFTGVARQRKQWTLRLGFFLILLVSLATLYIVYDYTLGSTAQSLQIKLNAQQSRTP